MTRSDRTRRKIERLRFKATILLAKNAVKAPVVLSEGRSGYSLTVRCPKIRGTKPSVILAERYFAKALALELGLKLREEAARREQRIRETQAREIVKGVRKVWSVGA